MDFLVQLDPTFQEIIITLMTGVVALAINYASAAIPWLADYLGQHRATITLWLTGLVLQLIQAYLNKIPESWDSVVVLVMQLIVEVIVVLIGFAYLNKKRNVQALS